MQMKVHRSQSQRALQLWLFSAVVIAFAMIAAIAVAHEADSDTGASDSGRSRVTIKTQGDKRIIEANGLPDHQPGQFPNRGNPNSIGEQHYHFEMPIKPKANEQSKPIQRYIFGVAVNGVVFDPGTAEVWRPGDKIVSRPGPNTFRSPDDDPRTTWNYDA